MFNEEILILEDVTAPALSFIEYRALGESFHNFLPSDVEKKNAHAHEVYGMLQNAYASQGGLKGSGFSSPDDMVKNIPMWKLHKKDGKVNAVVLYKDSSGRKMVAAGTDGSSIGRKNASKIMTSELSRQRSHMEVSGNALRFMKMNMDVVPHLHSYESAEKFHASRGDIISRPADDDKEVLQHPELKDHMYSRMIGGHAHTKVMLGTMGNKITEATVYDKAVEQENGKDSPLSPEPFKKGDWTFNPKGHAPSQAKERRPDWKPEYWHQLHDKVHAVLNDPKRQVSPKGAYPKPVKSGEALFYSGKQKQGYFANVDHAKKEIRLITVLPAGQSRVTKPTDQKIVLDHVELPEDTQIFLLD